MSGGRVFDQAADALAPFGRIVAYGIAGREQNTVETGRLMRKSRAVVGFWLMHCLGRRDMMEEPLADLFDRAARGELVPQMGDDLRAVRRPPGARGPAGPPHDRQAAARPLPLALSGQRMTTFKELGLSESTLEALTHLGYESPTPIQEQAIPPLLEGRDVIGQAQTGTGKTAAFGLPMVEYVGPERPERPGARAHADARALHPGHAGAARLRRAARASTSWRLRRRPDPRPGGAAKDAQVVVGTVGRVMDMIGRHHLFLDDARYVVLDEADEMLDLGFLEDVESILRRAPMGRQTGALQRHRARRRSAASRTRSCTTRWRSRSARPRSRSTPSTSSTSRCRTARSRTRSRAVLKEERPEQAIVFVRTKIGVDRLARRLGDAGVRVKALHGDMSQGQRDGVMIAFKGGRERLLVATDVAARGLDITGVSHVVNYDIPNSPDVYVHRIGRTGRAGESGRAITLITPKQRRELEAIERHAKTEIEEWSANGKPSASRASASRDPERETRRPRHTKPHPRDGVPYAKLVVGAGRRDGHRAGGRGERRRGQHASRERRRPQCQGAGALRLRGGARRARRPGGRERSPGMRSGASQLRVEVTQRP